MPLQEFWPLQALLAVLQADCALAGVHAFALHFAFFAHRRHCDGHGREQHGGGGGQGEA